MEKLKLNLYEKLSILQWEAIEIQKSGKNTHNKYDYKTFTDIKKSIMAKMLELKIAVIPVGELKNYELRNAGTMTMISYNRTIRVVNGDNPSEMLEFETPYIGVNTDASKASGSAKTYGLKYLFNELALLPDESLDPDTTEVSKQAKAVPILPKVSDRKTIIDGLSKYIGDPKSKVIIKQFLGVPLENPIKIKDLDTKSNEELASLLKDLEGDK